MIFISKPDVKRSHKQKSTESTNVVSVLFCASAAIFFCQRQNLKISYLYCVSDILTCKPALVFTMGALDEM